VKSVVPGIATQAHTDINSPFDYYQDQPPFVCSVECYGTGGKRGKPSRLRRNDYSLHSSGGSPFIGLFGTVWGVMETFSGIGIANAASLNANGAWRRRRAASPRWAGLSVAIPAMFAYNYMVTTIRAITPGVGRLRQ